MTNQNSDKSVQERMMTHATICNVVIHMVLKVTFIISARKGGGWVAGFILFSGLLL